MDNEQRNAQKKKWKERDNGKNHLGN
jgi:hypothetical protein